MAYVFGRISTFPTLRYVTTDGLAETYKAEGLAGWYRGTSLALFGVSNGALQFMGYEEMKRWGFETKRRQFVKAGREWTPSDDKLVSEKYPVSSTLIFLQVKHSIHFNVWCKQIIRTHINLPLPSN